jgi:hypothetical protein
VCLEARQPRTNASVRQLVQRHLELTQVEPRTLRTLRGYLRKHITPLIGNEPIGQLNAEHLDAWLAITTGARRGELCALRWKHLQVRHTTLDEHECLAAGCRQQPHPDRGDAASWGGCGRLAMSQDNGGEAACG